MRTLSPIAPTAVIIVALALVGCNTSSSLDGGGADAPAVGDSLADQIAAFAGTWQIAGALVTTCQGTETRSDVNDRIMIVPGSSSDLLVTVVNLVGGCTFLFDVVSTGTAAIRADQPCTLPKPPATINYVSWTILTMDGRTGSWTASGSETSQDPALGTTLTCSFSQQVSMTRWP